MIASRNARRARNANLTLTDVARLGPEAMVGRQIKTTRYGSRWGVCGMHPGVWECVAVVECRAPASHAGKPVFVLAKVGKRGKASTQLKNTYRLVADSAADFVDGLGATLVGAEAGAAKPTKLTHRRTFVVTRKTFRACNELGCCDYGHSDLHRLLVSATSNRKAKNAAKRHWGVRYVEYAHDDQGNWSDTPDADKSDRARAEAAARAVQTIAKLRREGCEEIRGN